MSTAVNRERAEKAITQKLIQAGFKNTPSRANSGKAKDICEGVLKENLFQALKDLTGDLPTKQCPAHASREFLVQSVGRVIHNADDPDAVVKDLQDTFNNAGEEAEEEEQEEEEEEEADEDGDRKPKTAGLAAEVNQQLTEMRKLMTQMKKLQHRSTSKSSRASRRSSSSSESSSSAEDLDTDDEEETKKRLKSWKKQAKKMGRGDAEEHFYAPLIVEMTPQEVVAAWRTTVAEYHLSPRDEDVVRFNTKTMTHAIKASAVVKNSRTEAYHNLVVIHRLVLQNCETIVRATGSFKALEDFRAEVAKKEIRVKKGKAEIVLLPAILRTFAVRGGDRTDRARRGRSGFARRQPGGQQQQSAPATPGSNNKGAPRPVGAKD